MAVYTSRGPLIMYIGREGLSSGTIRSEEDDCTYSARLSAADPPLSQPPRSGSERVDPDTAPRSWSNRHTRRRAAARDRRARRSGTSEDRRDIEEMGL